MPPKEHERKLNNKKAPSLKRPRKGVKKGKGNLSTEFSPIIYQLDFISDLSLIINSEGVVLASGKPQKLPGAKKDVFINKDIFMFYKENLKKEDILNQIRLKKYKTISLDLEYAKNKEASVVTRWSPLNYNEEKGKYFLLLNFVTSLHRSRTNKKKNIAIQGEFTWHSSSGIKDRTTEYSENVTAETGFSNRDIKRKPEGFMSIIYPDDYENVKKQYENFLEDQNRTNLRLVYRIERKDKKYVWLKEVITVNRDKKGKAVSSSGFISDVSDLMKADAALVKSIENLKKLNASKDKFISMLSHDLRAPFTSILGFAEILINEQNLSNTEKLEYLTYIHESSQNQLQLINYLLDWSRLQTGRMKIELQRLHAQSVVFNCVSSLTGNAIRKNIDIKVKVNVNIFVQADERLLTQVITNLLSNAIKYSFSDKIIEISAELFNDELIEFVVKDEGLGISEDNKNKLFKIERMFSTKGTKGEKGTGLGLSLVKEIIEKHKGDIWFYSKFGKGSDFHFTIPRSPNIILLVDPSDEDNKHLKKVIKKNFTDFQVIATTNGYQAMSVVLKELPSLVITEHEMPLMSGIQLIESIRRGEKNSRIPILLVTGSDIERVKIAIQNVSVFEVLQKPVNERKLVEKLDSALRI